MNWTPSDTYHAHALGVVVQATPRPVDAAAERIAELTAQRNAAESYSAFLVRRLRDAESKQTFWCLLTWIFAIAVVVLAAMVVGQ